MTAWLSYPALRVIPVGPFAIHAWGLFVAIGALLATAVAARRAARVGIARAVVWDGAFWVVLAGLVGARVLFVAEYWRAFVAFPLRAFAFWEGGMSAFGAVLLAPAVGAWYARRRGLDVWTTLHAVAPAALFADAIGRLGGAASHMYPGRPTTFPLSYVLDGVQRHEVGIELALASALGVLVLLAIERAGTMWKLAIGRRNAAAPLALLWYSGERFLLDFLRASDLPNSDLRYAGLTLAQWFAVVGAVFAAVILITKQGLTPVVHSSVP